MLRSIESIIQSFQKSVGLTNTLKNSIVYRYIPQRSPFDKTSYNEEYIPRPNKFHKKRKPRLAQWDDPNFIWPRLLPPPTKLTEKGLIEEVEYLEKQYIERQKPFLFPDYRPGDVVQFTYLHSISSDKGNTYTGLVIGRRNRKSLSASFQVIFRFCGAEICMNIMQSSPFLKDFKLISKGSGNLRSHLQYLWSSRTLSAELSKKPMFKGGRPRKRKGDYKSTRDNQLAIKTKEEKFKDPLFDDI